MKAFGRLSSCLLLALLATTAHARGGWDGNGLKVSGIAPGAMPAGQSRDTAARGIQVRSIQLPRAAAAARAAAK